MTTDMRETRLDEVVQNAHALLDKIGVPPADLVHCDDSSCRSKLEQRLCWLIQHATWQGSDDDDDWVDVDDDEATIKDRYDYHRRVVILSTP